MYIHPQTNTQHSVNMVTKKEGILWKGVGR